jgi:hypothetical protein
MNLKATNKTKNFCCLGWYTSMVSKQFDYRDIFKYYSDFEMLADVYK